MADDIEARLREAIGDQGEEGEEQIVRTLRLLAAGKALNAAALGLEGGALAPGPLENEYSP